MKKYRYVTILVAVLALVSGTLAQKPMDLGLSVRWADRNVGADSPEQYGDYFAWGEVKPKRHYGYYSVSKHFDDKKYYKYNYLNLSGSVKDDLLELVPKDDAATVRQGKKWRMPTEKEVAELISKCSFRQVKLRGANVCMIWNPSYADTDTIYIPCSGYKDYGNFRFESAISAYCWTSTLIGDEILNDSLINTDGQKYLRKAKCLIIPGGSSAHVDFWERRSGCTVRAVCR